MTVDAACVVRTLLLAKLYDETFITEICMNIYICRHGYLVNNAIPCSLLLTCTVKPPFS